MDNHIPAQEIAAALGEDWLVIPGPREETSYLQRETDQMQLYLSRKRNQKDRLAIRLSFPPQMSVLRWDSPPEIMVALNKAPATIAKDIHRRLLPLAEACWGEMLTAKEKFECDQHNCEATWGLFQDNLPPGSLSLAYTNQDTRSEKHFYGNHGPGVPSVRGEIYSDYVNLELRQIPVGKALAILHIALVGNEEAK